MTTKYPQSIKTIGDIFKLFLKGKLMIEIAEWE